MRSSLFIIIRESSAESTSVLSYNDERHSFGITQRLKESYLKLNENYLSYLLDWTMWLCEYGHIDTYTYIYVYLIIVIN